MVILRIFSPKAIDNFNERAKSILPDLAVSSIGFWMLQNCFQVFGGQILKINAGRPPLHTFCYGFMALVLSSYMTFSIPSITNRNQKSELLTNSDGRMEVADTLSLMTRKICMCICIFALIDRSVVSSAIPSSILSVGVFGNQLKGSDKK